MKCTYRQYSLISLEEYEREAIDFLKTNEPPEGYYVGFSGGKDSIVTLKLCQIANVKHTAYYSCTGIDEPSVVEFIKKEYPYVIWLKPKIIFWQALLKYGPPTRKGRWCCSLLKKSTEKTIPLKYRVMGIRAEESPSRGKKPRIEEINKKFIVKPIFNFKECNVWDFIEKYNLVYPSLYDDENKRIGCVFCPFKFNASEKSQNKLKILKEKHKDMFTKFEEYCFIWWKNVNWKDAKYKNLTFEEFMDLYYHGFPQNNSDSQLTNSLFKFTK